MAPASSERGDAAFGPDQIPEFRRALLRWYRRHRRRLPWREEPSLYKTVVSEFMLQQTQVASMLGHFDRWLRRFPDFETLTAAPEADVLKHWEGLGYYNRARNLRRLAVTLADGRKIPRDPEAWRALPGVGPYTAAAVTSITFGARVACVDGNVVRILARIDADEHEYPDTATAAKAHTERAAELLDPRHPGDHNQAMMELGATVCTRRRPRCATCPVHTFCRAAARGMVENHPRLAARAIETREVTRLWCRRADRLLLHQAEATSRRLANQYELPQPVHLGLTDDGAKNLGPMLARKTRHITRHRIREIIHEFPANRVARTPATAGLAWVPLDRIEKLTLSGPHRRWVRELLKREEGLSR